MMSKKFLESMKAGNAFQIDFGSGLEKIVFISYNNVTDTLVYTQTKRGQAETYHLINASHHITEHKTRGEEYAA